jgi:hypothetical protein
MKDKHICSGSWRFPCKNVRLSDKVVAQKIGDREKSDSLEKQTISCPAGKTAAGSPTEKWLALKVR